MRVVVTGARGQLGREVVSEFVAHGDEVTICTDDVTTLTELPSCDVVIHCAAMTNVDTCELDPERAHQVNALGTRNVVAAARDAYVVYVSTDYVFDGEKGLPYVETDIPNPINEYGKSKRAGELHVDQFTNAIVRTSWVSGPHGKNIVKTILGMLEAGTPMRFVTDQRGHPTFTPDLAAAIYRIAQQRRKGIWHVTNQGVASWFEFAQEVVRAAGGDPAIVEPITTAELDPPRPARRPANSTLDSEKLPFDELLPDYRDSLPRLLANLRQ